MELYEEGSEDDAKNIYENGAFSKSVSDLTISAGLTTAITKGTVLSGSSFVDDSTTAQARQSSAVDVFAYEDAAVGATTLRVQYVDELCYVGANPDPITTGCLASSGTLSNSTVSFDYTYDVLTESSNVYSIKLFTQSSEYSFDGTAITADFQKYIDFYGKSYLMVASWFHVVTISIALTPSSYLLLTQARSHSTTTLFRRSLLEAPLAFRRDTTTTFREWTLNPVLVSEHRCSGSTRVSRRPNLILTHSSTIPLFCFVRHTHTEVLETALGYLAVRNYVLRELEHANYLCNTGDCAENSCFGKPAVHEVDEAVAFYVGSLEGSDGSGEGVLTYDMANNRAAEFGTESTSGLANVNVQMLESFNTASAAIVAADCAGGESATVVLAQLMAIPLVQNLLKYSLVTSQDGATAKQAAERVAAAINVLPIVNSCSADDAKTIYENTKVGATVDYDAVAQAVANNYECLGISADDIGTAPTADDSADEGGSTEGGDGSSSNGGGGSTEGGDKPELGSASTRASATAGIAMMAMVIAAVMVV